MSHTYLVSQLMRESGENLAKQPICIMNVDMSERVRS